MSGGKPTIYIDTNIFSVLYFGGRDPRALASRVSTRDWWALERQYFQLWTSRIACKELAQGHYRGQKSAVAEALRCRQLPMTIPVARCAGILKDVEIVPVGEEGDTFHLAFATIHAMDYLLTWNQAHLANVATQGKLKVLCKRHHWRVPLLVSPDTIPKVAWGHEVRRRDDEDT